MSLPPRMKLKFHSSKDFANLIVPGRYPRGHLLLDTSLHPFFVKRKDVRAWAARAHETKILMKLSLEEEAEKFYTLRPGESGQARFSTGEVERGQGPLSAGGQGTRRFLVYLCLLSLHKKVGAGVGCVTPQRRKFDVTLL